MKTDYGLKYIFFKDEDREYCVMFRSSFLKGVYDIKVRRWDIGAFIPEVSESYPKVIKRIEARIAFWKAKSKLFGEVIK